MMDIGTLRGLGTVLVFVAFVGVVLWAYSNKRKKSFDEAANLPFADDETDAKKRDEEAYSSNKYMTSYWSGYIPLLTLGTIAALVWLLLATRKGQRHDSTEETVGHSYDGIEEYDNPLPRWWFMLFVATVIFALGYLVLYP